MNARGGVLYMRFGRTRMRCWVWFVLWAAACVALEMEVRANRDGKPNYQQYLAKVRHFFNVTGS